MPKQVDEDLSPAICNCLALRQATRHVSQIYDRHLAEVGLRTTQYSILARLARLGAISIGKLAQAMVMERTALSRAIGPLERDKLVSVGDGPNKRTSSVSLTAAGQAKLKAAALRWKEAQREFEAAFGAPQSAALRATLARVVAV
jgi:DNA-binding MarR family transcriptional regulator